MIPQSLGNPEEYIVTTSRVSRAPHAGRVPYHGFRGHYGTYREATATMSATKMLLSARAAVTNIIHWVLKQP